MLFGNHFLLTVKFKHVLCDNIWDKPLSYSALRCYSTPDDKAYWRSSNPKLEHSLGVGSLTGHYDKTLGFLLGF